MEIRREPELCVGSGGVEGRMSRVFTKGDWVTTKTPDWSAWLSEYAGKPDVQALEIGSCEGRSACWFMDNILTGRDSCLLCVDPWVPPYSGDHVYRTFCNNVQDLRVAHVRKTSYIGLSELLLQNRLFDFIYVDGCREARVLMFDLCASWELLKKGGVMFVDDYDWCDANVQIPPRPAIDAWVELNKHVVAKYVITEKVNKPEHVQQVAIWK
jgi:hypothetical protein